MIQFIISYRTGDITVLDENEDPYIISKEVGDMIVIEGIEDPATAIIDKELNITTIGTKVTKVNEVN